MPFLPKDGPKGLKPIGLGARDTLRLEMGYCLYGMILTILPPRWKPAWAGSPNSPKTLQPSEFLQKQKANGLEKKLVGFEMIDKGIPRHDYKIRDAEGNLIGRVTSGTQSPTLNKAIGMGYVLIDHSQLDKEIFIDIRDKPIKAKVVKIPFVQQ